MKGYTYYTVTLNNSKHGGSIDYSEVMCGDHILPISECKCEL